MSVVYNLLFSFILWEYLIDSPFLNPTLAGQTWMKAGGFSMTTLDSHYSKTLNLHVNCLSSITGLTIVLDTALLCHHHSKIYIMQ
jgi:hypothetical protein